VKAMVDIRAFRGIIYSFGKGSQAADLLAPPYDVITKTDREKLAVRHPHNVVRLILPESRQDDSETENQYSRAAALWKKWRAEKVLVQDESPAIYCYEQKFTFNGNEYVRPGFVALIRLEDLASGSVIPHELTHSGPKQDRLALIKATGANFSSIFSLYSDPEFIMEKVASTVKEETSILTFTDDDGTGHAMWRMTSPEAINEIRKLLKPKSVFIADGHHRYETALNYRNYISDKYPLLGTDNQHNFVMMYFVNMDNKGLVILPTHRMLRRIPRYSVEELVGRFKEYFDIDYLDFKGKDLDDQARLIQAALDEREGNRTVFCLALADAERGLKLTLKNQNILESFPGFAGKKSASMDVSVLQHVVFDRILELNRQAIDSQEIIRYKKDILEGLGKMAQGKYQVGFFLNPTLIDQVRTVAGSREIMPQKSTFFYPKIPSGLAFNEIDPNREVPG
jgi:uncharacterized protein (DUF1015 family)